MVSMKDTGGKPSTEACTSTGPNCSPKVACTVATPLGAVSVTIEESCASPEVTVKLTSTPDMATPFSSVTFTSSVILSPGPPVSPFPDKISSDSGMAGVSMRIRSLY